MRSPWWSSSTTGAATRKVLVQGAGLDVIFITPRSYIQMIQIPKDAYLVPLIRIKTLMKIEIQSVWSDAPCCLRPSGIGRVMSVKFSEEQWGWVWTTVTRMSGTILSRRGWTRRRKMSRRGSTSSRRGCRAPLQREQNSIQDGSCPTWTDRKIRMFLLYSQIPNS